MPSSKSKTQDPKKDSQTNDIFKNKIQKNDPQIEIQNAISKTKISNKKQDQLKT